MPKDFLQGARDAYDCDRHRQRAGRLDGRQHAGPQPAVACCCLEQHYKLGGMATWFKRPGGHIFDISLHGFPVGMIKSCRRYWTSEIADSIVQLKNIRFDNPMFSLTTSFDRDGFHAAADRAVPGAGRGGAGVFRRRPRDEFLRRPGDHRRPAVRAVLSRPRRRDPAADGADHLRQRLDAGRPGHLATASCFPTSCRRASSRSKAAPTG